MLLFFFFFNDTATTEIYTLSLHDALPILPFKALMFLTLMRPSLVLFLVLWLKLEKKKDRTSGSAGMPRPISYAVFCLKKKIRREDRAPDSRQGQPDPRSDEVRLLAQGGV